MNEIWLEKIEQYLEGTMSAHDESLFEAELITNEELAGIFAIYRAFETYHEEGLSMPVNDQEIKKEELLRRTLKTTNATISPPEELIEALKKQLPAQEKMSALKATPTSPAKLINFTRAIVAAAALVSSIVLGIWWFEQNDTDRGMVVSQKERDALFGSYFEVDTDLRGNAPRLQEARNRLINEMYKDAIVFLDKFNLDEIIRGEEDKESTVYYIHYYKAQGYLAMDSTSKAITELKNAKSSDPILQTKTTWYLALAYLKTGHVKESKALLQQLTGSQYSGEYKQNAIQLLSELNKKESD